MNYSTASSRLDDSRRIQTERGVELGGEGGVFKKFHAKCLGVNLKTKWNFQGRQEKFMWNFQGSWSWFFGLEISEGCNIHNFTKFPGVELCFTWNFQGCRKEQKKFQGFFSKKNAFKLPCLFVFSGIAHSKTIDLNWSYKLRHFVQKEVSFHWPYVKIGHLHHFHVFYYCHRF